VIKTDRINMKYLTGVLNSKAVAFWLHYKGKMQGNQYQIDKEPLMSIPIPPITSKNKTIAKKIESLVDEILQSKIHSPDTDTSELEREIDRLVCELYKLTPEEIEIVEGRDIIK